MHLEQRRAVVEHRPAAEAGDAVMTHARDIGTHCVDAVLEAARGIELEIGGRKAELAAALFAVNDLTGDEPRGAKELGCLYHPARGECRAHGARRHRPALVFEWRNDVDGKTETLALLAQEFRRAGAVLAEMKIEADSCTANAKRAGKDLLDEILGGCGRQRRIELHDDGSVEPARSKEAQLVLLAGQLKQGLLRPQEQSRVRRERQRGHLALELACALERSPDHRTMTTMHAIEVADRHDRASKRAAVDAIRAAAHEMKPFGRRISLVHQKPENWRGRGQCRAHIP